MGPPGGVGEGRGGKGKGGKGRGGKGRGKEGKGGKGNGPVSPPNPKNETPPIPKMTARVDRYMARQLG